MKLAQRLTSETVPGARTPFWSGTSASVLERVGSTSAGLSTIEAARRLELHGPNRAATSTRFRTWRLLLRYLLEYQYLQPALAMTRIADPRTFFNEFLDDGFVIGLAMPFFAHVQGWWNVRELPNVLLVHFANLKADMPREIRRIAEFLDIQPGSAAWPKILEHCSFDYMKRNADSIAPKGMRRIEGGTSNFFHKGTNGRWRDVLTPADLSRFAQTVAEKLTPDCARWLETGVMLG